MAIDLLIFDCVFQGYIINGLMCNCHVSNHLKKTNFKYLKINSDSHKTTIRPKDF